MKKRGLLPFIWIAGLGILVILLGLSLKSRSASVETEVCTEVQTQKGGELLYESLSRQFVSSFGGF